MNKKDEPMTKKRENFRISKSDRKKMIGKTNWAALIIEERKEGHRK